MERLLRGVEPEARSRELTQAEKAQAFLEEQLAKITSRERARRLSMTAFGGADSGIPGGMGAVDFVPFLGSAKGLEEGVRDVNQAAYDLEAGRYGSAARNYGSAVLGVLPGAAGAVKVAPGLAKAIKATPLDEAGALTKPLTKKQFEKQFAQHIDIRGRENKNQEDNMRAILEEGFRRGFGPNAVPPYAGGAPLNIMSERFRPQSGDVVYLAPQSAWQKTPNGMQIVEGWKPEPEQIVRVQDPNQSMYEAYLANFNKPKAVKGGLGYDQAKIAMQYPDVAPPVLAVDPKTGKEFLQKQLSNEARAVEKVRKAAQKDIDAGKYTPFFNLEERYYADATKHPLQGRTVTDALPKKKETIDKYRKQYDTPEARKRLTDAFKKGSEDELAKNWYAMGQLEAEFINEFGPEVGRNMFKERFADAMAATTGGADPTSNLLMGAYGNYLRQHGVTQPKAAYEFPYPIGGRFASGNMAMYDKVINQGAGLQSNKTPKRFDFSANFLGHRDRATIDEQMSGGFDPKLMVPPGDSYGIFEAVVHDLARQQGVQPANFQDVSWAGLKGTKGKPMMQHINEAIERTRRVTGKKPEEIVRDSLVRGTHPLYGVAGTGLTAGALAAAIRDQRGDDM
jgi:hypothetical protein